MTPEDRLKGKEWAVAGVILQLAKRLVKANQRIRELEAVVQAGRAFLMDDEAPFPSNGMDLPEAVRESLAWWWVRAARAERRIRELEETALGVVEEWTAYIGVHGDPKPVSGQISALANILDR